MAKAKARAKRKRRPTQKTTLGRKSAVQELALKMARSTVTSLAARRTDLGAPITLAAPTDYYDIVREVVAWYKTDTLFQALISRIWEYGNNRADWVVIPTDKKTESAFDWEQGFWNFWAQEVNADLQNVIDGLDTVNGWLLKKLAMTQLGVVHWEWGYLKYKDKQVWCPLKIKVESSLAIRILAGQGGFGSEQIWLYRGGAGETTVPSGYTKSDGKIYTGKQLKDDPHWEHLRPSTSFAIKLDALPEEEEMNYTGQNYVLTPTIMPAVRWQCLVESMRLRRQLARGDLAVLDALINFIILWRVGNDSLDGKGRPMNQPQPERTDANGTVTHKSTVEAVSDLLTTSNLAKATEMILPYFIDIELKQPDTNALLSVEKYFHSTQSIFESFGIFSASKRLTGDQERDSDISNFEQYCYNIRVNHVSRFWEMVARRIMGHDKNKAVKFKGKPSYHWRSLNTQTDAFRSTMAEIMKMGQISIQSFHRVMGLNPRAEIARIRGENTDGTVDAINDHVPTQFVQTTVGPDGQQKTTGDAKDGSRGRPKKAGSSAKK